MIEFEWDKNKNRKNQKKHGISFEEAESVFYDELAVQFYDDTHSYLVLDRESIRSEGKSGFEQNFSLFEKNSWLFDENKGKFWQNSAFPQ